MNELDATATEIRIFYINLQHTNKKKAIKQTKYNKTQFKCVTLTRTITATWRISTMTTITHNKNNKNYLTIIILGFDELRRYHDNFA